MQPADDSPAVSPTSGPAQPRCPAPSAGAVRPLKPAWFVVVAIAGTLLVGLYPAGGPAQGVGHGLSVLLTALLWFATGYWWARRRATYVRLTSPGDFPDSASGPLASSEDERARVLGSAAFVGAVVQGVVEKMSDEVPEKVADRLAREVMDSAGDRLADAVAGRIADAWQRAARTSNAAASNGWTLRPRQRGSPAPRGRNPKA